MATEADRSKELLNREARAAHKSLIEPTPKSTHPTIEIYVSSQQHTPTSPTTSRLKTRRSKTSVEKPKAKKPLQTYGRSSQDVFEFRGGSDGELDVTPTKVLDRKSRKGQISKRDQAASRRGSQDEDVTRKPTTSPGGDTEPQTEPKQFETSSAAEIKGPLQSFMPPPASKSASFDRSQRSQTDRVPTIADAAHPESTTSTVLAPAVAMYSETHSEHRKSALAGPSCGKIDEERSQDLAQSVRSQSMHSNEARRHVDLPSIEAPAHSSSASDVSPSQIITIERMSRTQNISEFSLQLDSGHLGSPLNPNMPAMDNPVMLLPAPTDAEGAQDELSLSIPEAASKTVTRFTKASKRKKDTDDEPLDELGSDDNALGVRKELYQPRPSKRRAGGGDGDIVVPTDFSKRPEAIGKGKRKTKRHKTTAFEELLPKDEDEDEDEEIKVVPDPRFEIPEKKTPKVSTESEQLYVERNDNTEEIRPGARIELSEAPKVNGQKKRGRPKKAVTSLSAETVVDETEADHQDDAETTEHVSSVTAKKSRRKSKNKETAMPIINEQDSNSNGAAAAHERCEAESANILNETNGNINPPNLTTDSPPETSPAKPNAPPETPRKSTTPAPKGPDKHSPISTGKVAYRVGLSKRARIAPLLRIVRK